MDRMMDLDLVLTNQCLCLTLYLCKRGVSHPKFIELNDKVYKLVCPPPHKKNRRKVASSW